MAHNSSRSVSDKISRIARCLQAAFQTVPRQVKPIEEAKILMPVWRRVDWNVPSKRRVSRPTSPREKRLGARSFYEGMAKYHDQRRHEIETSGAASTSGGEQLAQQMSG